MKRFSEYINEFLTSQIDNNMSHNNVAITDPTYNLTSLLSDTDIIHIEFKYKDKLYTYDIKYNDINLGTSENIDWHVIKVEKDIKFDIHAQKPDTGRYNVTTINLTVDIIKDGKKIDEITPDYKIISQYNTNNLEINIRTV